MTTREREMAGSWLLSRDTAWYLSPSPIEEKSDRGVQPVDR